jgi:hypothetical protein
VEYDFFVRDDGQVDVSLGTDLPLLNRALNNCISSLPPRGADGNGPSVYWINLADQRARQALEAGDDQPFIWGNETRMQVHGHFVVASYNYDESSERVPLAYFLTILDHWRSQVLQTAASATQPLPDTYRRNPI